MEKDLEKKVCTKIRMIQGEQVSAADLLNGNHKAKVAEMLSEVCKILKIDPSPYLAALEPKELDPHDQKLVQLIGVDSAVINFLRDTNLLKNFI